jgi:hypothetical protein
LIREQLSSAGAAGKLVLLYLLPFSTWMLLWVTFFPGLMNADSIHSWTNVTFGVYDESQTGFLPIAYSWLARLWNSPGAVTLSHIILMMAALHHVYAVLRRLGAPDRLLGCIAVYFAFSPFIGTSLVTVMKDTPSAILQLLLLLFSIQILETNGEWLTRRANIVLLALTLAFMCLVRHEGWISAATFAGCLILFFSRFRRRIGAMSAIAAGLVVLVQGPLFSLYHVDRNAAIESVIMQCSEIAVVYNHGGAVTPAEAAFIDKIAPAASWRAGYEPYSLNNVIFFNPKMNLSFAYANRGELASVWKAIALRNWEILLESRGPMSAIAWSIPQPPGSFTYAVHLQAVEVGIDPNTLGLHPAHLLPGAERVLRTIIARTSQPQWIWLFYRPALYLYVFALSFVAILIARRKADSLLLVAPLLGRIALIALFALSQDSRFFLYAFLLAPVMAAYAITIWRARRPSTIV